MKKIVLIILYFGKLPNYFKLWLKAAEKNQEIDFLLITDDKSKYKYPKNVRVIYKKFTEIQKIIKEKISQNAKIKEPYKLCDYRPLYKFLFEEEIKNYDFFGWCDLDIIFGDIRKFITNEILEKYNKIYTRGHLTLIRNVDENNKLIKCEKIDPNYYTYKEVISTDYACHFDEWGGISRIYKENKIEQYDNIDFADINMKKYSFNILFRKDWKKENAIFVWDNGKLFMISKNKKEEILYAHFQKRTMSFENNFDFKQDKYIIIPNKFCNNIEITKKFINDNTKCKGIFWEYYQRRIKTILTNIKNGAINQRIYRFKKKIIV